MTDKWQQLWDNRFKEKTYAYGIEPNTFLKQEIDKLKPAKILFGAEGEGRNAIYAATLGWQVDAFDISKEGQTKALQLAKQNNVSINYTIGFLPDLNYLDESFDTIALIYAHFPAEIKHAYHQILNKKLKKGGTIIFEAFGKKHIEYKKANPKVGGPGDLASLFSVEEIQSDFKNFDIIKLEETEIELKEGLYHNGKGSVVRFIGVKK